MRYLYPFSPGIPCFAIPEISVDVFQPRDKVHEHTYNTVKFGIKEVKQTQAIFSKGYKYHCGGGLLSHLRNGRNYAIHLR